MECYYKFNQDINQFLNLEYINRKANEYPNKGMILVMSEYALTPSFFDYLKPYGLRDFLMLFLRKSGDIKEDTHTDYISEEEPHHYSFNMLCKGQGTMTWYHRPEGGGHMYRHPANPSRIIYEKFDGMTLVPIDKWTDGKMALVRTGIPHGVINNESEDRICLSIRIDNYGWEEAKEIYNNYFKNVTLTDDSNPA